MAEPLTIMDIAGYDTKMGVEVAKITNAVNAGEISAGEATVFFETISGQRMKPVRAYNGDVLSWVVDETANVTKSNPINSNAGTISRGTLSAPVSTNVNQAGKAVTSRLAGVGSKVATYAGKVAVPLTLASIGITLGKTIDETLYNFNPDYWDSIGMSSLNPQTWSSLVGGDGTVAGSFFNAIFGIDPATGDSQAYIDANALAYASYCMQNAGMFDTGTETVIDGDVPGGTTLNLPLYKIPFNCSTPVQGDPSTYYIDPSVIIRLDTNQPAYIASQSVCSGYLCLYSSILGTSSYYRLVAACSNSNVDLGYAYQLSSTSPWYTRGFSATPITLNNVNYGIYREWANRSFDYFYPMFPLSAEQSSVVNVEVSYAILYNDYSGGSTVPGIGNQTGATIPDFSSLTDESQYLPYLQQTYPDMFNNAISYPVMQDDGTVKTVQYVPITLPDSVNNTNPQPISGDQTQANPVISPSTSPDELIELLTKLLQQPETDEATDDITPPENPTDTGDGSSPVPIVPVGSASSLWKIYHPTQAQIDSFGGWLWSSNFIDQILKIFNNPM